MVPLNGGPKKLLDPGPVLRGKITEERHVMLENFEDIQAGEIWNLLKFF